MSQGFTDTFARRLRTAQRSCAKQGLGGLIVGTGPQLAYFTGSWTSSHERLTALVITADVDPVLLVPATDVAAVADTSGISGLTVQSWRDGQDPYAICAQLLGSGPVALGNSLTAVHVLRLQDYIDETVPASRALSSLMQVKDSAEIAELSAAATAIDRVHARVPQLLQPGRTEAEVARELEDLISAEHDTVDFVIVGSGPNGADPHHDHSERVLEAGDPVVVDIGGSVGRGYHSDCTRTYTVGPCADREFLGAYEILRAAQARAVASARPGMTAGDVDALARSEINRSGYGRYFTHRLGHGIGLDLHEEPFIVAGSDTVLREGMVFSIEPGIYVPGKWGMRIEDIVVLEASGARSLNAAPRSLCTL